MDRTLEFPYPSDDMVIEIALAHTPLIPPSEFDPEKAWRQLEEGRYLWGCGLDGILGRDKVLLGVLSGPLVPFETVRQMVEIIKWTLDSGMHQKYRENLEANFRAWNYWEAKVMLIREAILDPNIFREQLDLLLTWKESAGEFELPGGIDLFEYSQELAGKSAQPEQAWRLLLSGIPEVEGVRSKDYRHGFRVEPLKRINLTPSRASSMSFFNAQDMNMKKVEKYWLFSKLWRRDMWRQGFDSEAMEREWWRLYGVPWIHVTEQQIDDLLTKAGTAYGAYGEIASIIQLLYKGETFALTTLLNLAKWITPGSPQAMFLVGEIYRFAGMHYARDFGDGSQTTSSKWPKVYMGHDGRVVQGGFTDAWIEQLLRGESTDICSENPQLSAPEVVSEVSRSLDISENAATYFLQLMGLTVVKDSQVKAWNDWSSKELEEAQAALVEWNLVVEDKRAGAGRKLFLPGGWLKRSDHGPAMEVWKAPHYLLNDAIASRPVVFGAPLLKPAGKLFEEVWERYASGDVPGHMELRLIT